MAWHGMAPAWLGLGMMGHQGREDGDGDGGQGTLAGEEKVRFRVQAHQPS